MQGQTSNLSGQTTSQSTGTTSTSGTSGQSGSHEISKEILDCANSLKSQVESKINCKSNTWNVTYFERFPSDSQHQCYYIKVCTDNNGHVRFKASQQSKLSSWELEEVEEFDRGNVSIPDNAYQTRTKETSTTESSFKPGQQNIQTSNP